VLCERAERNSSVPHLELIFQRYNNLIYHCLPESSVLKIDIRARETANAEGNRFVEAYWHLFLVLLDPASDCAKIREALTGSRVCLQPSRVNGLPEEYLEQHDAEIQE